MKSVQSSLLTGIADMLAFRHNRRSRYVTRTNLTTEKGSFNDDKKCKTNRERRNSVASLPTHHPSIEISGPIHLQKAANEDNKADLMTMSFYQCPSTPSSSSNSSSGYSGTPTPSLCGSSCSTEMHRVESSCTLVPKPWKSRNSSYSQKKEDPFSGSHRDSGCDLEGALKTEKPRDKSDCEIFLRKMSQKLDQQKRYKTASTQRGQDRPNRNSIHVEDDNEAYLLGLLSTVGDVVVNRKETFFCTKTIFLNL